MFRYNSIVIIYVNQKYVTNLMFRLHYLRGIDSLYSDLGSLLLDNNNKLFSLLKSLYFFNFSLLHLLDFFTFTLFRIFHFFNPQTFSLLNSLDFRHKYFHKKIEIMEHNSATRKFLSIIMLQVFFTILMTSGIQILT